MKLVTLQALQELIAADNQLEHLPNRLWQGLSNLRTIMLYGNTLRQLPVGCFSAASMKGKSSA